jgi:hypothetical protein
MMRPVESFLYVNSNKLFVLLRSSVLSCSHAKYKRFNTELLLHVIGEIVRATFEA